MRAFFISKEIMMTTEQNISFTQQIAFKISDYKQLSKFNLSFTVVFTCVICYLLAPNITYDLKMVLLLFAGGMLITGSANAINQAYEKHTDALMKRTSSRPVAAGRMTQYEAYTFALITGIAGFFIMWNYFNLSSALLSAFSIFLYGFIYTPLKKVNSIAVLVGAFPGALPCLIGWVAGTDLISPFATINVNGVDYYNAIGWALFAIQFVWQFPHFWAIAWLAYEDYNKAGFKLLPSEKGPSKFTALQGVMYSALMVPIGLLPYYFGISGHISLWIVLVCNIFMVAQSIRLLHSLDVKGARRVMFSSYIYLPIVYLSLLVDKVNV